ncbi:MAG: hypothetical protein K5905_27020 [Roseibium sp.]|uniref:hypothetical protein n=1 Tax=Roseibium sp. TaxID=1936156 RepID=UPI00261A1080|nr:hypothetical protein [Roseibium sp.]MCV0429122.1 hypothetical protein [Roseibium sp.]
MIDQNFQAAISRLNRPQQGWKKLVSLFVVFGLFGFALSETLHYTGLRNNQLDVSDEMLGKLAAFAACSSGQSPTVEWDRALGSVSLLDQLLGQSRMQMLNYFLSVIDTQKCAGPQTASA